MARHATSGRFTKGNKSGTQKKSGGGKKPLPAFLARKLGKGGKKRGK